MTVPAGPVTDGRTLRRERNVEAALAAVHDLVVEGHTLPSIEEVADRSGVSLRSLYRYFSDSRQMQLEALFRRTVAAEPLYVLAAVGEGSLAERVDVFVDQRITLYEQTAATIRAAFALAPTVPAIAEQIEHRKRQLAEQAERHFAAEVGTIPAARTEALLACVELLCQFESIEMLRVEHGHSMAKVREILVLGLRALLESP